MLGRESIREDTGTVQASHGVTPAVEGRAEGEPYVASGKPIALPPMESVPPFRFVMSSIRRISGSTPAVPRRAATSTEHDRGHRASPSVAREPAMNRMER